MPIMLIDRKKEYAEDVLGVHVTYRAPGNDQIRAALRDTVTPGVAGDGAAIDEALVRIAARYVTSVVGLLHPDGAPVQWPDPGKWGYGGPESPAEDAVAMREEIVRALPLRVIQELDRLFSFFVTGAADSGKGSPSV